MSVLVKICSPMRIGIISLILVVLLWTFSNFILVEILENYKSPTLVTLFGNISFMTYFLFLFIEDPIKVYLRYRKKFTHFDPSDFSNNFSETIINMEPIKSVSSEHRDMSVYPFKNDPITESKNSIASGPSIVNSGDCLIDPPTYVNSSINLQPEKDLPITGHTTMFSGDHQPLTTRETAKIAFYFFAIYLASNSVTNKAFEKTMVSSASILAATSGFFTLLLGRIVGVEKITFLRAIAVLVSVGGVLIMGIPMFQDAENHLFGNLLALLGAFLYGLYSVFLKKVCVNEDRLSMPILFAFGGLYTLVFGWILLLILHFTGLEVICLPPNFWTCILIGINTFFGVLLPNYLWSVAFQCTSPLIVAIGTSFMIPLTIAIELIRGVKQHYFVFRIMSGVFIILGFIIASLADFFPLVDKRYAARFRSFVCGIRETAENRNMF